MFGAAGRWRASTRSPIGRRSSRTSGHRRTNVGCVRRQPRRSVSRGQFLHERFRNQPWRHHPVRRAGPRNRSRRVTSIRHGRVGRQPGGGLHVCVQTRGSGARPTFSSDFFAVRAIRSPRPDAVRSRDAGAQRLGDRRQGDARHVQSVVDNVTLAVSGGRHAGDDLRLVHLGGSRRHDQVPAGLRGRDLQDPGRDAPADCRGPALRYGLLGLLAGAIGSAGALALTWGISRFALDIPFRPLVGLSAAGVVVTAVVVAAAGVLASWEVLQRKPLSTLRAE